MRKEDDIITNCVNVAKTPSWEMRIRNAMNRLSSSECKVAEFILKDPESILAISVQKLAKDCGVSEATVVRFLRDAGFSGMKGLKTALIQTRVRTEEPPRISRKLDDSDSIRNLKTKVFWGCIDALTDTVDQLDDSELSRAIEIIEYAPFVEVFGIGGSASVARSALHSFRNIGLRMNITTDFNFDYLRMERFNKGDAVIAISRSGETKSILEAVRIAKEKGAVIISITNAQQSTLRKLSDCCLSSTSKTSMLPGDETYERVAQIAIINALYAGVAIRLDDKERSDE